MGDLKMRIPDLIREDKRLTPLKTIGVLSNALAGLYRPARR
jgi:hypothetical protein